jgi:site-specific DNA recombinase
MNRPIIYARYSTDKQSENSIEDQTRVCRAYANAQGWDIQAVHADEHLTGSSPVASRKGGAAMLADVLAGRADILLLESLDRLSRDMVEQEIIIRRIEHLGIRIIGVSDGYDTASSASGRKLQRTLRGLINEVYLDDLRAKTHRGLAGQVERGHHAGGLSYGYQTLIDEGGHTLSIHPGQAETVRWIFRQYALGWSCQRIVSDLNARQIPSPRGSSWSVGAVYGSPKKGTGILNNETYLGRYIWNKSQWVKDPDTKIRKRLERPQAEWKTMERPDLQIVTQAEWQDVRDRMASPRHAGGSKGKGAKATTLFGGFMTCGQCGGAVVAVNQTHYGCANRNNRGPSVCKGVLVPRKVLDASLLGIVRDDLLSPAALTKLHQAIASQFEIQLANSANDIAHIEQRIKVLDKEITNLANAIAQLGLSPALGERLIAAEAERQQLKATPTQSRKTGDLVKDLMPRYKRLLLNFQDALQQDTQVARKLLASYFKGIRLDDRDGEIYADLNENAAGLLMLANGGSMGLVAGTGFEPMTFGL